MSSDLENSLMRELDDVATDLVVPPLPDLAVTSRGRRRLRAVHLGHVDRLAPFLVAAAVIVLAVILDQTQQRIQRRGAAAAAAAQLSTPTETPRPSATPDMRR